jgi:hypothetical protein
MPVFVDQRVRDAELAFLNAPFAPDGWTEALRLLARATDTGVAQLCGGGEGCPLAFNYMSDPRHDPHRHLENPDLYGPGNWRIGVTHRARTVQFERDYAAYRAHNRLSAFYDDAISDLDLPFGCQSALMLDASGMFGLALLRSTREGPCTPETIERFTIVARQAHRAVRMQMALGEESAALLIGDIADRSEMTILLDRHLNVLAMTELAESLFDQTDGLDMVGLRIAVPNPREDRNFLAACGRLLASDGIDGPLLHETRIGRTEEFPNGRWRAVVVRIGGSVNALGVDPQLAVTLTAL